MKLKITILIQKSSLFSVFFLFFCVGCMPAIRDQQPHAYEGPRLPETQLAVIYGDNGGGGDGTVLVILSVDGIKTTVQMRGARKVYVPEGQHNILVSSLQGNYFMHQLTVPGTFEVGHIYQLRHSYGEVVGDKKEISIWVEDMGTNYTPPLEVFPDVPG